MVPPFDHALATIPIFLANHTLPPANQPAPLSYYHFHKSFPITIIPSPFYHSLPSLLPLLLFAIAITLAAQTDSYHTLPFILSLLLLPPQTLPYRHHPCLILNASLPFSVIPFHQHTLIGYFSINTFSYLSINILSPVLITPSLTFCPTHVTPFYINTLHCHSYSTFRT